MTKKNLIQNQCKWSKNVKKNPTHGLKRKKTMVLKILLTLALNTTKIDRTKAIFIIFAEKSRFNQIQIKHTIVQISLLCISQIVLENFILG